MLLNPVPSTQPESSIAKRRTWELRAQGISATLEPAGIMRYSTRNWIIAGWCDVLLVVEVAIEGGAPVTARTALDFGAPYRL